MTRTNCTECYNMTYEEMNALSGKLESPEMLEDIRTLGAKLDAEIKYNKILDNTISIQDLIYELSKLNPNDRITVEHQEYDGCNTEYCTPEIVLLVEHELNVPSLKVNPVKKIYKII